MGGIDDRIRVAAGIITGTAVTWKEFNNHYDTIIEKFIKADGFWGKDQTIMRTIAVEYPNLISLLEIPEVAPEKWFYSLLYLGCTDKLFGLLCDTKRNHRKLTYNNLLKLS